MSSGCANAGVVILTEYEQDDGAGTPAALHLHFVALATRFRAVHVGEKVAASPGEPNTVVGCMTLQAACHGTLNPVREACRLAAYDDEPAGGDRPGHHRVGAIF